MSRLESSARPEKTSAIARPSLTIRLFGKLRIWWDDTPIPESAWAHRKAKKLLAYLLLRAGETITHDALIDVLLDSSEPTRALRNLYSLVSRLRKTLQPSLGRGAESAVIRTMPGGYSFSSDIPCTLDTEQFDRLIHEGLALEGMERYREALTSYRQALDLRVGEFLEEFPYDDWALQPREHWEEKYCQALGGLASCQAATGNLDAAIETCRRLIELRPFDEMWYRKKMLYHYSAGEMAEATRTYRRCRMILEEDLGETPSTDLTQFHEEILESRAARLARWVPTNLPHPVAPFVGRKRERRELETVIRANRLVTLVGPGGIGKTELALKTGHRLLEEFPDGVWFVPLEDLALASHVAHAVLTAVGLEAEAGGASFEELGDEFAGRKILLILDTCEHLVDSCAKLVAQLLAKSKELRVLATSRESLGIPGEVRWLVPPLLAEESASEAAGGYCDAVQLFLERAQAAMPSHAVSDSDLATIRDICHRLDGIPLAIELAASQVPVLRLSEIASQIGSNAMLSDWHVRTERERHRSLGGTLAWSFETLASEEQAVLRRAAVFSGGFDLAAAEEILADGASSRSMLKMLSQLVQKSLVVLDRSARAQRYRLLGVVRMFASKKLTEAGEEAEWRTRHRDAVVTLVEAARRGFRGPLRAAWERRVDDELGNVRAALAWSMQAMEPSEGLRIATALAPEYWADRFLYSEALEWIDRLLSCDLGIPEPLRAEAFKAYGALLYYQAARGLGQNWQQARDKLAEAADLYMRLGDQLMHAKVQLLQGLLEKAAGSKEMAGSLFHKVRDVYREVGNRSGEAACLGNLAVLAMEESRYRVALELLSEGRDIARDVGNLSDANAMLRIIGVAHEQLGEHTDAVVAWRQCLADAAEVGDVRGEVAALVELATVGLHRHGRYTGDNVEACALWERARLLCRAAQNDEQTAYVAVNHARYLCCSGEYQEARTALAEVLPFALKGRASMELAKFSLMLLAEIAFEDGDLRAAGTLIGATKAAAPELLTSLHRRRHEKLAPLLRGMLGTRQISEAIRSGESMSTKEAVEWALSRSC